MSVKLTPCALERELFLRMAEDYIATLREFDSTIRWDEPSWNHEAWHAKFIMEDRTVQGFVVTETVPFHLFPDALYIAEFYVVPEARRRDLGIEAVKAATEGWEGDVYLYILEKNTQAKLFWAAVEAELGWKRIERPEIRQEAGCELRVFTK